MIPARIAALAARAAGDHPAAIQAWRAALAQTPGDGALALELKQDLRAAGQWPDADPAFRRAARNLPDREWLNHYAALYAFHADDLAAIDARARTLLTTNDPRPQALIGDVARQRRHWPEAATAFDAATAIAPDHPDYALKAALARQYARLAAQPSPDDGPPTIPTILNLDRNPERMAQITRELGPTPHRRHQAVDGARLPALAVRRLTGNADAPRGTLGCFLSHLAAWETLLDGPDECAFIIEDDAIPLLPLPPRLGAIPRPPGWDLLWVNDRLEPLWQPGRDPAATTGFTTVPLATAMQAFHPEDNAPGADGYLISRTGAQKLLAWTETDGMEGDIDWRMVAYGMTPADVAAIPPKATPAPSSKPCPPASPPRPPSRPRPPPRHHPHRRHQQRPRGRQPRRVTYLKRRAGLPTTVTPAPTAPVTTAPAPTIASSPTTTPGRIIAPPPIHTFRPIATGRPSSSPARRCDASRG